MEIKDAEINDAKESQILFSSAELPSDQPSDQPVDQPGDQPPPDPRAKREVWFWTYVDCSSFVFPTTPSSDA